MKAALLLGAACVAMLVAAGSAMAREDDELIGWSEDYTAAPGEVSKKRKIHVLSWEPRIFLLENILSDGACVGWRTGGRAGGHCVASLAGRPVVPGGLPGPGILAAPSTSLRPD